MATVIKLVNELIGKEDINWGDASSTFTRETYTGGNVSLHYIDDTVIPATVLGGYVDDHLHVQNTDTGTTSTTFTINSSAYSPILSSSGLTADRTFTFPNTSNQALIGATDLLSTSASYGASLVGVISAATYYSSTTVQGVLTEYGVDITTLQSTSHNSGMKNGFRLAYSSPTAITISGGIWAHNGTTNQHVYTSSEVTFTLGPSGSNGSSSNITGSLSTIHYIYIHNDSIVSAGSRLLTAAQFINSTTAPAWSESKVGWYNNNDRCIGAVLTTAAGGAINVFYMSNNSLYIYGTPVDEYTVANAPVTTVSLDLSSSVPKFSDLAFVRLQCGTSGVSFYFGESPSYETIAQTLTGKMSFNVNTNSSQLVYWYCGTASASTGVSVLGYYTDRL